MYTQYTQHFTASWILASGCGLVVLIGRLLSCSWPTPTACCIGLAPVVNSLGCGGVEMGGGVQAGGAQGSSICTLPQCSCCWTFRKQLQFTRDCSTGIRLVCCVIYTMYRVYLKLMYIEGLECNNFTCCPSNRKEWFIVPILRTPTVSFLYQFCFYPTVWPGLAGQPMYIIYTERRGSIRSCKCQIQSN